MRLRSLVALSAKLLIWTLEWGITHGTKIGLFGIFDNLNPQGSPVASAPAPDTYGTPQAQPAPDNYGAPQTSVIGGSGFNAFAGGSSNSNFQTSSQGTKIRTVAIS